VNSSLSGTVTRGIDGTVWADFAAITTFRAGIQTVANAQLAVDRLKRIKKRFETPIATLCSQLSAEKQTLRGLETTYTSLSQQQQAAAATFFSSYQTRINHYLGNVFKTHFKIDNVVHVAPQGRATQSKIAYKLTIEGKDISFVPNQPFNAKECLSEGDKSTIALAFFLSKLDIDSNRQDKILIFDDPLSSLDTNRRTYTIGIIKALFHQMKQVVVLSHNEFFLHEIGKDFGNAVKKTLRITENFAAKSSVIEECDLDSLVKIDYFKHIEALEAFRISPDHTIKDTVLGWLRNVLEAHLRFKFYKEIRSMTGQKTFGSLISFLDTSGVVFRDNGNRATIISNLHLINGVSWKQHHGDPNPDYTELGMNPNTITAPELDNLIQDTLNLIEVQL
jgi:ABC-type polar amino acid transport system ATPase subunit